jgi:uncharacterized protein YndB with AHSA1/START domain
MKVNYQPDQPFTADAAQAATGKPLESWFQELDARGGPGEGRKSLGDYLMKEKRLDAWWTVTILAEYEKSRGFTDQDGRPRGYNICVTKTIAAPAERVYAALADTSAWLGPSSDADLREGGAFRDGDGHSGVFRRLTPGKLLRFTWEGPGHQPGETVEIKLTASGAKTSLVLNHERLPDRAAADGMRGAWGQVLNTLKEKLG